MSYSFSKEGYRGRALRDYNKLKRLKAVERYKLDEVVKLRLRSLGFDMTDFYPPAGDLSWDDETVYFDSTTATFDGTLS